ncbi:MAG: 4-(cytidine 5'-diphospho)-2-C-methyl-D-erythritol kinase [Alphaproteobacteria bacterium]|nr:4-(cytidine 5'-diphospho)-2-C-methyl-D-erythritol kinase [Alphaproteobacteria bacterium]MBU1525424.1 4-(cytidine 5'-diphospho)-2-C-methyl-D-erythritol kinase [Alphaproteobacteria bacterium]MBU2351121.1 4-(cytidine 5'-diphospho)-2-C-methyl-D-erythritol kinase [Alphaproteobacteria bacterium]MBU2382827.1 4-(cytidine 5'-diphospho)-2-C-methyl-D-erythritol kinase [Alphaproteobacteria bacterium]
MRLRAFAPAKVNLFLHVDPPRADGKHPLVGLTAFADVGDVLTLDPDGPPGLQVKGPLAAGVPCGSDNLVARALAAFSAATGVDASRASLVLDKRLPSAAGIGGGTSDAGTALRLARAALAPDVPDAALLRIAAELGADGPMCLFPRVAWTEGLGEVLTPEPRLPPLHGLLVNPGVPVPTGAVFAAHDGGPMRQADRPPPPVDWSPEAVVAWLGTLRNDLQPAAEALHPEVAQALRRLAEVPDVILARMSGSGGTVFGLCRDAAAAARAARDLSAGHAGWWLAPVVLHDMAAAGRPIPAG